MKKISRIFMMTLISGFFLSCADVRMIKMQSPEYSSTTDHPISPAKAFELAQPHLDACYALRQKSRLSNMKGEPRDIIVIKGNWYYIARDNYPYKTLNAYLIRSVKVHAKTGEVLAATE